MARSIQEIYNALAAEKASMSSLTELQPNVDTAQDLLNDVTSTSKVAEWRLWLWVVAFATHVLEKAQDVFKAEVEDLVAATKAHTLFWYQQLCFNFQYGDDLVFDEDLQLFKYPTEDQAAKIITNAATDESNGRVIIKVAKASGKLDVNEVAAFQTYLSKLKDAGTDILLISTDPDDLKATINIYYNPLVLKSDGTLISDSNTSPVEDAMQQYIDALEFNGAFVLTDFVDALQAAEGVDNPVLTEVQVSSAINPYSAIDVSYLPYAGYYQWDLGATTINYIANV